MTAQEEIKGEVESNEPTKKDTTTWKDRFQRWLRKYPSTPRQAAAALLMIATTVACSYYYYYYHSKIKQRRKPSLVSRHFASAAVVPLSLLLAALEEDRLTRALLGSNRVYFQTNDHRKKESTNDWKRVELPLSDIRKKVWEKLSRHSSSGTNRTELSLIQERDYWGTASTGLLAALPFIYLALLYRLLQQSQVDHTRMSNSVFTTASSSSTTATKITFRDVAGLDDAIAQILPIVHHIQQATQFRSVGATAPRGILLYGPPGTGKTLLARAVAAECDAAFCACSASDFVEVYVGRGAARVRRLFANARHCAQSMIPMSPSLSKRWWWWLFRRILQHSSLHSTIQQPSAHGSAIIFIDELDALAKTRTGAGGNDEREQTLNQLLTEMDGFHTNDNDQNTIIVMAATNRPDCLDPAIRRRFERQVYIGYPDVHGREAILKVHARKIRCTAPPTTVIHWDNIAEMVGDNVSGAELRNLINEAALAAVRDGDTAVTQLHLEHAARRIRNMKVQWNTTSDNFGANKVRSVEYID